MFSLNIKSANLSLARSREKPRRRSLKGNRIITLTEADLKFADELSAQMKAFARAQAASREKDKDIIFCADKQEDIAEKATPVAEKTAEPAQTRLQKIAERTRKRKAGKLVETKEG